MRGKVQYGILGLLATFILSTSFKEADPPMKPKNNPAYVIYNGEGKEVSYTKMIRNIRGSDAIFIGELHDNPISHWMQLQVTKDMYDWEKDSLVLGAEMFEADNQLIMDEYLQGFIKEDNYNKEMRLWPNYKTDYRPLVEFARERNLPFIATNVPRRYASMVFSRGLVALDSLSDEAKQYMAPLPIEYDPEVSCYKKMLEMGMGHGGDKLPKAQALKDATMSHFILKNWREGLCFVHYNGAYHSDNKEGIVWYLKNSNPEMKISTLTTVLQDDVSDLMDIHKGKADYVICIAADMTSTH